MSRWVRLWVNSEASFGKKLLSRAKKMILIALQAFNRRPRKLRVVKQQNLISRALQEGALFFMTTIQVVHPEETLQCLTVAHREVLLRGQVLQKERALLKNLVKRDIIRLLQFSSRTRESQPQAQGGQRKELPQPEHQG